jgi:hypothetical protein
MGRKGGPNNTLHHYAEYLCRGFSKNAKKDLRKNLERENKEREQWRSRKDKDKDKEYESEASTEVHIIYTGSNFMPNIGSVGLISNSNYQPIDELMPSPRSIPGHRSPSSVLPSRVGCPPKPSNTNNRPVEEWQPPPGLAPNCPSSPQEPTRIGWPPEPSSDGVRPSRSRRRQTPRPAPIYEPTAIRMTEERGPARLPTHQAALGDNDRTLIEGMRPLTTFGTGRRRRCRHS